MQVGGNVSSLTCQSNGTWTSFPNCSGMLHNNQCMLNGLHMYECVLSSSIGITTSDVQHTGITPDRSDL